MEGVHDSAATANAPPPFLSKTYDMVDDPATDAVVSWSAGNNSFVVWNVPEFSRDMLPKYFKHSNFSSFVRQLNTYGFRKVDPDRFEFANEGFLRGQKHLLKGISRRKSTQAQSHQQASQVQSSSVGSCVELGKFGLEEEVERLKRDKNVLMQELVKLRQQQQTTDQQLQTVGQRVHMMEQRQQQMMAFLAKAVQSPGFLAQLVNQQNESNRRIPGANKKRRLPNQEEENLAGKHGTATPDGQIVKYQPSMNEAAKAMLRQIMKMNATSRLEPTINNGGGFLIDDVPSSNVVDSGSSSSSISGVTLSEVLSTSLQSRASEEPGDPVNCPSVAISEIQAPGTVTVDPQATHFTETGMLNSQSNTGLPDLSQLKEIMPETTVEVPNTRFKASGNQDIELMDSISDFLDGSMQVASDELLNGIPNLPGINDVFWEQFLSASPLTGDTDEICVSPTGGLGELELQVGQEGEWEKTKNMSHLTEQMGLLASNSKRL